jgi:hypothetical protein
MKLVRRTQNIAHDVIEKGTLTNQTFCWPVYQSDWIIFWKFFVLPLSQQLDPLATNGTYYPNIFLMEFGKIAKILSQDTGYHGRDLNWVPSEIDIVSPTH